MARTIGDERGRLAALERVGGGGQDFLVQMRTSIFDFCFSDVDELVGLGLFLLVGQVLLDRSLTWSSGTVAALLVLDRLDDVVPELGRDDVADLARLEREGGLSNAGTIWPAREEVEVAALRGAAVRGILLRELGEVLAPLGPLQDRVDARLGLLLGRGVRLLVDADQDVAGAERFALLELVGILVVELLRLGVRGARGRRDLGVHHLVDAQVVAGVGAQPLERHVPFAERLLEGLFVRELLCICLSRSSISASVAATLRVLASCDSTV